jgi:hypothetical protein
VAWSNTVMLQPRDSDETPPWGPDADAGELVDGDVGAMAPGRVSVSPDEAVAPVPGPAPMELLGVDPALLELALLEPGLLEPATLDPAPVPLVGPEELPSVAGLSERSPPPLPSESVLLLDFLLSLLLSELPESLLLSESLACLLVWPPPVACLPASRGRSTPVFCRSVRSRAAAVRSSPCASSPDPMCGLWPVTCRTTAVTVTMAPSAIACSRRRLATSGQKSAVVSMRVHAPREVR